MRRMKLLNYIYAECVRVFRQPKLWIAIIAIAVIKFINLFGNSYVYDVVIRDGIKEGGILNLEYMWGRGTFLEYVVYCLAALPVVGNYIEDYKSGRLNTVLTRISKIKYAIAQICMVVLLVTICTFAGNILFMVLVHCIVGLPYVNKSNVFDAMSDLMQEGKWFTFYVATEIQNCMQTAFYTMLAVSVSLFIKEKQFIVVLPMFFRYIFVYFINGNVISWYPDCISPRAIYLYNFGMFIGDDIAQSLYSVSFTLCVGVMVIILMHRRLRKEL